jgi:hypothetical protein
LGVFGYLSKAHSDQSLVSGDVQSKIAVYDEKIKTAKDNIDANRKALKQMDEAVDQVMGRSSDEKGADKAVQIRRSQQKERARLQSEIAAEQKTIAAISEERAPIAAEVRKVEAEVGPIKYIAHLLYGENPDANVLEKSVIWVTVLIVIVLDPLAVVLLLASQYSFQYFRERGLIKEDDEIDTWNKMISGAEEAVKKEDEPAYEADNGPLTDEQIKKIEDMLAEDNTSKDLVVTNSDPTDNVPVVEEAKELEQPANDIKQELTFPELVKQFGYSSEGDIFKVAGIDYTKDEFDRLMNSGYVQNEEQLESGAKWNKVISEQEYREQIKEKNNNDSKNNPNNAT